MQVTLHATNSLREHASLRSLPPIDREGAAYLGLVISIQSRGILDPLKISADGRVVDGRHRLAAAKQLGLAQVPTVVVDEAEAAGTALDSVVCRRHMTPGQLAYVSLPLVEPAFEEAARRKLSGGAGDLPHAVRKVEKGLEAWASELGLSTRLLQQAKQLAQLFADETKRDWHCKVDAESEEQVTAREFYEHRLLRTEDPLGLGGVITAISQVLSVEAKSGTDRPHTGGAPKEVEHQMELFTEAFDDLKTRYRYWEKWQPEERKAALKSILPALETMPDDLLKGLEKQLKSEQRRRKAEAKASAKQAA